jgi:precorrin-6Y C5,15-methyltransferase (decarboxylating)
MPFTLENLNTAIEVLSSSGFSTDVTLVNVSRSTDIGELTRLQAMNPVFIITGVLKYQSIRGIDK